MNVSSGSSLQRERKARRKKNPELVSPVVNIRSAKAHLSDLVNQAGQGREIIITSHGWLRAKLVGLGSPARPFQVDFEWLRKMKVKTNQTPAEVIVREARDACD